MGRRLEFTRSTDGEVIRGKIGPAVADPDSINQRLHQPATITVLTTQVGNGKPRYVLLALPSWSWRWEWPGGAMHGYAWTAPAPIPSGHRSDHQLEVADGRAQCRSLLAELKVGMYCRLLMPALAAGGRLPGAARSPFDGFQP